MSKSETSAVGSVGITGNELSMIDTADDTLADLNVVFVRFPFMSTLGGEELHTMQIARYFKKKGAKVSFVGSCRILLELFDNEGYEIGKKWSYKPPVSLVSLILFTLLSPILFVKSFFDVLGIKLRYGRDVRFYMLGFTEKLLWSPWVWMLGMRSLWLEHARFGNWFFKNPWKIWYKIWSKKRNVKVITVSDLMKKEMGMDWVKVITNAVNGKRFKKICDASSLSLEMRRAFARKNTDIGFVGRFSEDKGAEIILKLVDKFPEVGFICVGNGDYKKKFDKKEIDNMWLEPSLMPCFMQNIELLLLPATKTDPFGLVVLEAMHAGTPVLMTDKCGVAWHLKDGENAFVCKVEEFEDKLAEILENKDVLKKVTGNLPAALEQFDYSRMLERYWDELL